MVFMVFETDFSDGSGLMKHEIETQKQWKKTLTITHLHRVLPIPRNSSGVFLDITNKYS